MGQVSFNQKQYRPVIINILLILVVMFVFSFTMQAQVTIGSGEEPVAGSILQLKDISNITDDTRNSHKGLVLPRVNLSDKNQLYPMFLTDPENPDSGPDANYSANKASLDKSHTGLIVYNLIEDDQKQLCRGLNQWDGTQWLCFQNKIVNATFATVNCSDITTNGTYIQGNAATPANYLKINLDVTRVGPYTITATTGNGYSFYLSGVASNIGRMTVNVPCQGTPVDVQTDNLTFSGVSLASGCTPAITVASPIANYSMNCSSIEVNGRYMEGTPLTSANTITLSVKVTADGSYTISTPLTNGISFSGTGNLTEGIQTVTLTGSGTPTVNADFPITVSANTQQGSNICSATIPITLPAMTYAVVGDNVWSWGAVARKNALNTGAGFGASFGPDGIVKIIELTQLWQTNDVSIAADNLNSTTLAQPDIVLYFSYGYTPNSNIATALANYINRGGCVIYAADGTAAPTNMVINAIFGVDNLAQAQIPGTGTTDDNDYQIADLLHDPLINGPFGNLTSKYWGEDNESAGSIILTSLPSNSVQICSANNPFGKASVSPDYSIVWYNDQKNFVYFGDSTGADINNTSPDEYPSDFAPNGLPLSKLYGNYPHNMVTIPSQFTYNTALELNAVAWALKKAAVSGVNPH